MERSLLRRLFHFSGVVIPITYLLLGRSAALVLTASALVLLAVADILRIFTAFDPPFLRRHLKEKERKKPTASLFYMTSCLLVILLFDKPTAMASIFVLVVSDPLSAVIGSRSGQTTSPRQIGGGNGRVLLLLDPHTDLVPFQHSHPLRGRMRRDCGRALLSSRIIDDNFSIPVVTALVLTILSR